MSRWETCHLKAPAWPPSLVAQSWQIWRKFIEMAEPQTKAAWITGLPRRRKLLGLCRHTLSAVGTLRCPFRGFPLPHGGPSSPFLNSLLLLGLRHNLVTFLREKRPSVIELWLWTFFVFEKGGDDDVATNQGAIILPPSAVGAHPIPPFLDTTGASLGRVTSWSGWPLNFPFAPPSSGSDSAVTTPRQGGVSNISATYPPTPLSPQTTG